MRVNRPSVGKRRQGAPRKIGTAVAALLVLCVAVSACGSSGISGGETAESSTAKATGKASGSLTISNWPYYISPKTIPGFEKATGIKTTYLEDYNSNEEFYGKLQPLLANGESGGRSLFAGPSPYIVERMIRQGYAQKLEKNAIKTVVENASPDITNPAYDPGNKYSYPWMSGLMGIAVRTDLAPDIKSACDLFNPKYKGKVELFTEMRQTLGVIMKCMGVDFSKPITEEDWMAAVNKVKQAKEDGQLRKFAGNDWTNELLRGDVVASTGAAGDTYQLEQENPNVKWVMPEQGCIIFTNAMTIPVGAPNATAAYAFMNYVYEPKHAAQIVEYTHYLSPVAGVQQVIAKTDPELAENELVFPSKKSIAKCSPEPQLSGEMEQKVTAAWNAVING
ncbi:MAG: spermidine/putrescine ABC transporter substrate-binding protein [Actinobacteria bacterium]|nr:spermidine/putrescine ABC transporter substrate-binding protein [Actinomycetota bacterium]